MKTDNYYLRNISENTGSEHENRFRNNNYYLRKIAENTENGGGGGGDTPTSNTRTITIKVNNQELQEASQEWDTPLNRIIDVPSSFLPVLQSDNPSAIIGEIIPCSHYYEETDNECFEFQSPMNSNYFFFIYFQADNSFSWIGQVEINDSTDTYQLQF